MKSWCAVDALGKRLNFVRCKTEKPEARIPEYSLRIYKYNRFGTTFFINKKRKPKTQICAITCFVRRKNRINFFQLFAGKVWAHVVVGVFSSSFFFLPAVQLLLRFFDVFPLTSFLIYKWYLYFIIYVCLQCQMFIRTQNSHVEEKNFVLLWEPSLY